MYFRYNWKFIAVHIVNAPTWQLKNKRPTWCHLRFYFTSYVLNTFRTLIYPSSGAREYAVELPHCASACNTDTTQTQPHQISNTQRNKNKTTSVVIQQHSRKLLMMDILMSETCWVHKKQNKIARDIKLVFYSSAITMIHGPINIIYWRVRGNRCLTPQGLWSPRSVSGRHIPWRRRYHLSPKRRYLLKNTVSCLRRPEPSLSTATGSSSLATSTRAS